MSVNVPTDVKQKEKVGTWSMRIAARITHTDPILQDINQKLQLFGIYHGEWARNAKSRARLIVS